MNITDRLQEARYGWTKRCHPVPIWRLTEVSAAAHIPRRKILAFEEGRETPTVDELNKLAAFYKLTTLQLMSDIPIKLKDRL